MTRSDVVPLLTLTVIAAVIIAVDRYTPAVIEFGTITGALWFAYQWGRVA